MSKKIISTTLLIAMASSASAFASDGCINSGPCQLEQASANVGQKIGLLPLQKSAYTVAEMKAEPPVTLTGVAQFRFGQIFGWCVATPDCKAKLRAALEEKEGPWADGREAMLRLLDDPRIVEAQQVTWTKGEGQ